MKYVEKYSNRNNMRRAAGAQRDHLQHALRGK